METRSEEPTSTPTPDISIVVPLFNEVENVRLLADELIPVADSIGAEIIIVDDGSTDGSGDEIRRHDRFRYVRIARSGKSEALRQGVQSARGQVIAMIDADLQEDPRHLPDMVALLGRGYDGVNGVRVRRRDPWIRKRLPSLVLRCIVFALFARRHADIVCGLRVARAATWRSIPWFAGTHRLVPLLIERQGGRVAEFPVSHRRRRAGVSKYLSSSRFGIMLVHLIKLRMNHYG